MNIASTLNQKLLQQPFSDQMDESSLLIKYQQIAYGYAAIENSIAVLSDLKSNRSYIYNGGVAKRLGIAEKESAKSIDSIWEEDIFERIHPEDMIKKHTLELQFFHLLKTIPIDERSGYYITSKMRMKDQSSEYILIKHRMFYICSCSSGSFWLALCLYNFFNDIAEYQSTDGIIVNSATGETFTPNIKQFNDILTRREKEILLLIDKGRMSKQIADMLSISIYTINRHRQNILEKLRVKNSHEACRVAKIMGLI